MQAVKSATNGAKAEMGGCPSSVRLAEALRHARISNNAARELRRRTPHRPLPRLRGRDRERAALAPIFALALSPSLPRKRNTSLHPHSLLLCLRSRLVARNAR